jgi:hypothetical protein
VEEIFLGCVTEGGACFGARRGFDAGVHDEGPAVTGEAADKQLVEMPGVEGEPEAALSGLVVCLFCDLRGKDLRHNV